MERHQAAREHHRHAGDEVDVGDDPLERKLYTTDEAGARIEVSAEAADDADASRIFPDDLCDVSEHQLNGRDAYDMNGDGVCRTRSHPSKNVTSANSTASDRVFFREWLYGWEDQHDPAPAGPTRTGEPAPAATPSPG